MNGERNLSSCGCCEGVERLTPLDLYNRPALSALVYRVGTHARFKASMLAGISTLPALSGLTTRRDDDPTIALVDSWALVLDVLTFYQERIANEGFLRTAAERRSLLELARTIGYELRPGVAASTHFAFTLDSSPDLPPEVVIPAGLRAQSVPGQNEMPQAFETSHELTARPEWSELRPRLTHPQIFSAGTRTFYFKGTATGLDTGDALLLVDSDSEQVLLRVTEAEADTDTGRTRVEAVEQETEEPPRPVVALATYQVATATQGTFGYASQSLTSSGVAAALGGAQWRARDLAAVLQVQRWPVRTLTRHIRSRPAPPPPADRGLFALRVKTAVFGHNAQPWSATPTNWRVVVPPDTEPAPYPQSWETGDRARINRGSSGTPHVESGNVVYLERAFDEILDESWLVLKDRFRQRAFRVASAGEQSVADFGLSGQASRLALHAESADLDPFTRRGTTVLAQSEPLELAELPIPDPVADRELELDQVDFRLEPGRVLVLTGERADLEGQVESEVVELEDVLHTLLPAEGDGEGEVAAGFTRLVFKDPLAHPYRRETVSLNANVAHATHGETVTEILGSGDAGAVFQRFTLKQKPLTHVSAPVPSGGISTLEVRVNGIRWTEAPDLWRLGPDDRGYVLLRDDDGNTTVQFGDGVHGARLPSGAENVTATYRFGIGQAGEVDAGRITLLATRPAAVREVVNPVPAAGAENPEERDGARRNAPLTVLTLDRIVSLSDFEDFARAFSGIGKARAAWVWDGSRRVVHVTVAAVDGDPLLAGSDLYDNLLEAMDAARDPFQPLVLGSYGELLFTVKASVRVHPDHQAETVLGAVEERLREAFSFEARDFAQGVSRSELVAVAQSTEGVVAVDLETFDVLPGDDLAVRLVARPARLATADDGSTSLAGAELLSLAPGPVELEVDE